MSPLLALAPFAAAFIALGLAGACAAGLTGRLALGLQRRRPAAPRTGIRAAIVLAPAIVAALGCAALAFPDPYAGCHCAAHGLHHPHLCLRHPAFALPLVAPAACVLAAWAAIAAPRALRLLRDAVASARRLRAVRRLPAKTIDGVAIRIADCGASAAFTAGALSPVIVVDRLLWGALSHEERLAVAHHEQGHVERRDGLTLLALRGCVALFPMPAGRRLLAAWRVAAEIACDRYAAAKLGDAAAVAAALVAVEQVRARSAAPGAVEHGALGVEAGGDLEQRVLALLGHDADRDVERLLANDAVAAALVALGAGALTVAWPGGSFHHAIETLIGSLIR